MGYRFECSLTDRSRKDGSVGVFKGEAELVLKVEFTGGLPSAWLPAPPPDAASMDGAKAAFHAAIADGPDTEPQ